MRPGLTALINALHADVISLRHIICSINSITDPPRPFPSSRPDATHCPPICYDVAMNPSEPIAAFKSLAPLFAARGVTGLSVFGSRTTGEARADSDIDVIVDYNPDSRFSLLDLVAVGRIIEEYLGIKADVITRPGLHPVLRHEIESKSIRVY